MKKKLNKKRVIVAVIAVVVAAAAAAGAALSLSRVEVCIDPGHGGYDSGAEYEGRLEKDDNLELALLVNEELEARGIKTCMTRDDDRFISLSKRCSIANIRRAKLFVALHRNSADGAHGVEVWVHSDMPQEDTLLAQNICDSLSTAGISENRGVKFGFAREDGENYFVNSRTKMPSCLAELGFITDDEDNRLFDENIDAYAEAIADAIEKTLSEI